uniref:FTH domain-containing protein n=1 Tax=Panagrellus redivivus TaxID=6233 RepID=A0A7E4W8K5_PANRE
MAVATLKPHLAAQIYDNIFDRIYQASEFRDIFNGRFEGNYYNNTSDSGSSYHDFVIDDPPRIFTYERVSAQYLLKVALPNKFAFRRFLYFLKTNFTLRFRKKQIYLHHSDPSATYFKGQALGAKREHYFKKFYNYATKVSFYKVELGTEAAVSSFVRRLENLFDLRHIDMTGEHGISAEILPKMAKVFAKLPCFDVDARTFIAILEESTVSFPHLEYLKLVGNIKRINKIVTTSERFPLLRAVEIVPEDMMHETNKLIFAENPFPTIKNFTLSIDDNADDAFTEADFELIKNWLKKFPSLTEAKIVIKKWIFEYPHDDPKREERLHAAFQSTDFGGAYLDLTFHVECDSYGPHEELEERFACFEYDDRFKYSTFIHNDSMPGKKFEHILNLKLDW